MAVTSVDVMLIARWADRGGAAEQAWFFPKGSFSALRARRVVGCGARGAKGDCR
jgi:hypothetical protein